MGYCFSHLIHKELCTTAKWLDLDCADYVVRWYMIGQDLLWSHSAIHYSYLLLWILDDTSGHIWYFQVCIGSNNVMMMIFSLTSHMSMFYKPYTLFPCLRFFPRGFVG